MSEHTPENDATYLVEVQWDKPGLPRLVGPFETREEATDWGVLNIPNGTWNVAPLAHPYMRSDRPIPPALSDGGAE